LRFSPVQIEIRPSFKESDINSNITHTKFVEEEPRTKKWFDICKEDIECGNY